MNIKAYEKNELEKMAKDLFFSLEMCEIGLYIKMDSENNKSNLLDYLQDKVESEYNIKPLSLNNNRSYLIDYNLEIAKMVYVKLFN